MAGPASLQVSKLNITSTVAETGRLHEWLDEALARLSVHDQIGHAVRLCVEEAAMNVILHGYGATGPGPVQVSLWPEPPGIVVQIVDTAPRFDPTQAPPGLRANNLQSGSIGGHGLKLIRRYADRLRYEYVDGENRLTMGFGV